ncbi:hypothetical protein LCGC14_2874520, partial [marine sediment metagenome]
MTQELVPIDSGPPVSLLSGSPQERIREATAVASALAPVINDKGLYARIGNKRYALYEATCLRCGRITNAVTMVDAAGRDYFMGRTKFRVCRCLCGHTWRESEFGRKGFPKGAQKLTVPVAPEVQRVP